jgi:hypothetical protein
MTAKRSVIAQINKMLKLRDADYPKINALFIKLVIIDPVVWQPLYQAYLTKRDPNRVDKEPEARDPFDREKQS